MSNDLSINIKNKIYNIRGKQVMLDSDLAVLYQCKNGTKEINQAVKNNLTKFPLRYSFVLTDIEKDDLRSKFLTTNFNYGEFAIIKSQSDLNSYKLSVKEWTLKNNAIGIISKPGRYVILEIMHQLINLFVIIYKR